MTACMMQPAGGGLARRLGHGPITRPGECGRKGFNVVQAIRGDMPAPYTPLPQAYR
jgi:hypothetical protein